MESLPLDLQFYFEATKRFIINHPEEAAEYTLTYFEDYLFVLHKHKQLEARHRNLQVRHDQLQSELINLHFRKSPSLPSFLPRTRKEIS